MTKEIYDRSIETGELQLVGFWANFSHFLLAVFFLFMPAFVLFSHAINFLNNVPDSFQDGELWIIIIGPILSVIVYWMQKRRLKFLVVATNLNHVQLKEILIEVAEKLKWEFISSTNAYVAKTDPGFLSGSWGEQITILFYQDKVFVNSICDPNKRSSVSSLGRNGKNEETLINRIKEVDKHFLPGKS